MVNVDEFAAYRHASHRCVREEFAEAMIILNQLHESALEEIKIRHRFRWIIINRNTSPEG